MRIFVCYFICYSLPRIKCRTFEEDLVSFSIFNGARRYRDVISILNRIKQSEDQSKESVVLRDEPLKEENMEKNIMPFTTDETEQALNSHFIDQVFEGDIVLSLQQAQAIEATAKSVQFQKVENSQFRTFSRFRRKVIRNKTGLWTSNIINYDYDLAMPQVKIPFIEAALNHWTVNTCLRFERRRFRDYILFVDGSGCYSNVGRLGGKQELSIGLGCEGLGVVSHEIGHVLGFWHEQSRPERDDYIKVNLNNVVKGARANFLKLPAKYLNSYGVLYDLGSVMHYGSKAFTKNIALNTIDTLDPNYIRTIGQRNQLSYTDIKQINALYCADVCKQNLPCTRGGYPDPSQSGRLCDRCKCPEGLGGTFCDEVQPSPNGCATKLIAKYEWQVFGTSGTDKACNWLLIAPQGSRVAVTIDTLQLDCRISCVRYVEVKYRDNFEQTGSRFCCKPPITKIISARNEVVILYRVDSKGDSSFRFTARFRIDGPTHTISAPRIISSPRSAPAVIRSENPPLDSLQWSPWSSWTKCSVVCGGCGIKERRRYCYGNQDNCLGSRLQKSRCGLEPCSRLIFGAHVTTYCCENYALRSGYCMPVT